MPKLKPRSTFSSLPTPLSTFIGRERELAEVKHLLESHRLVTVTGPGGAGKTRLALEVANELWGEYEHGAWLIELAPLSDEALVTQTIAFRLHVREQTGRPLIDTLADHLRTWQALLVIDNCEHLIHACAQFADAILRRCLDVRILATSREMLGLTGESVWVIPSLGLPQKQPWKSPASAENALEAYKQSEAVKLFVDRAASTVQDFVLSPENGPWVAEICRRLDGMPLAIELAAARARTLSVQQIAQRLDDRFHLLVGGSRVAEPRQQTLSATLDWSYALLSESEKKTLQRLSTFSGGCTLEAAEAVCSDQEIRPGEILDILSRLVDKSLVVCDKESNDARYVLLETIRQFAHERLVQSGEAPTIHQRHGEFFVEWVDQMEMELRAGPTQLNRFHQLEEERSNVHTALEWLLDSEDRELGIRLAGAMFYFWWRQGYWLEWRRWTQRAEQQLAHISEASRARTLIMMCALEYYGNHNYVLGRRYSNEALEIFRRLGIRRDAAWAIYWSIVGFFGNQEQYAHTIELINEAIALFQAENDLAGVAQGFNNLGVAATMLNDNAAAKSAFQKSLDIARTIGDEIRVQLQYSNLGSVTLSEGDFEASLTYFRTGMMWAVDHANLVLIHAGLTNMAFYWAARGALPRSARLFGANDAFSEKHGINLQPSEQVDFDHYWKMVQEKLGTEAFQMLLMEGREMTLEQAVEYALETNEPDRIKKALGGLTAREREVALLIARGKSNREIAGTMTVGVKTIETYVTRILHKLGFESRVQIATWAVDKGLGEKERHEPG